MLGLNLYLICIIIHFFSSSLLQTAGLSDGNQAGDHHGDTEHPSGGQDREDEEVSHNLRGYETRGNPPTGGHTKRLSAGGDGMKPKKTGAVKLAN